MKVSDLFKMCFDVLIGIKQRKELKLQNIYVFFPDLKLHALYYIEATALLNRMRGQYFSGGISSCSTGYLFSRIHGGRNQAVAYKVCGELCDGVWSNLISSGGVQLHPEMPN